MMALMFDSSLLLSTNDWKPGKASKANSSSRYFLVLVASADLTKLGLLLISKTKAASSGTVSINLALFCRKKLW